MSIDFIPYVLDAKHELWHRPAAVRVDPDAFEMNVSNANGAALLLALGLAPDTSADPMPIDTFAGLVTAALRRLMRLNLGGRSPEQETVTDAAEGRMTIVFCGRPEGYIEEQLGNLARLIQRSRAAGATHIGWG